MTTSQYANLHRADWVPNYYDEVIYDPAGYDTFIWTIQRRLVQAIVGRLARGRQRFKYLDFATGTGRIISTIEHLTTEAVGLDISEHMLAFARRRTNGNTPLKVGDILDQPDIVDADFDLITAFRFFLNTEPELRLRVMRALAQRLAGPSSRLIFNVHGNAWSSVAFKSMYQQFRGWGPANRMSYTQIRQLVEDAGLRIETFYGFGLAPHRLYRTPLAPLAKWIDRSLAGKTPLRWISHDLVFVCRRAD